MFRYQCNYFHLQSIQAYRYNYEIPGCYYRQHWRHNYGCWSCTRQYLSRKAPNVRKVSAFYHHLYKEIRATQLHLKRFVLYHKIYFKKYLSFMSINKERIKHVITRAITSISRVSRLTGAIMRSLGIITESIDVTIMPVGRTLVNICRWKESSQREKG